MTILNQLQERALWIKRKYFDFSSLQVRLISQITLLSILSLGSIAVWSSWKMQQILIEAHTKNLEYVANRIPQEIELYSGMLPLEKGIQKTIDSVSTTDLMIWVKDTDNRIVMKSMGRQDIPLSTAALVSLLAMPLQPRVYQVDNQYLILVERPITIKGKQLGKAYLAQDVTNNQKQLISAIHGLAVVSGLVLVLVIVVLTLQIQRSLRPLQEMNQAAGAISAEDLSAARLNLSRSPTEVKELAQTFNLMLSRLADAWEQQRQLLNDVSHELRTPLTLVMGYLESLIRRSTNLSSTQLEALETAASEANRAIRLLQDLLDLARADSGYLHFRLESLSLNDLIVEAVDMAKQVSHRSILAIAPTEVEAIVDRDRLRQTLLNLLDNAIKYSQPDQPVYISLSSTETQAIIEITDQGVGISLAEQSRIFDRFYRVDESRARTTGGHGLGLAIVKSLVEGMGGRITVLSEPNQGSTFTITLRKQA